MANDRDGDALGVNQSKRPATTFADLGDQPQQQHTAQHPGQQHHRARSQRHVVGGVAGGRMHARVPSSKGLHKHHAATSTAKLNRKSGSLSPDRGAGLASAYHNHRRTTSELKLSRDPQKNAPHSNLKRNRSQIEVGKKTKSTTNLHRSLSNPAVAKLRSSEGSKVQFNLGDEDKDDFEDEDEGEWVDASTSASPLLSRRGSAVSGGQTANPPADDEDSEVTTPMPHHEGERTPVNGTQSGTANATTNGSQNGAHSLPRNQYLTSRILSRTPSHGAPPMMSTETVQVRPSTSRPHSPPDARAGQGPSPPGSPGTTTHVRPGSSGKAELTSRFVGNNSQEPGSGIAGESFIQAANLGGLSRAALNGNEALTMTKRRPSSGAMSQARGIDAITARQNAAGHNLSDGEDEGATATVSRVRRSGDYVVPRDMNRTQQKLNLQRASSSLEPAHPHLGIGIGPAGVGAAAAPLIGVPTSYDSRDPRISKILERTGMEYLTVRRHLNPVARSIARVMQLPDLENSRRIPRSGTSHHASRLSEQFDPNQREPITRNSSMADLINPRSGRRPPTPRSGAFSTLHSASSSLGTDDGASRMHERQALSGSSLVNGAEDAETMALLRMMWDKNMNLSASQD
ncbi:uncharacterized protein B0T15DRAFT_269267 [Chaetomium strumarium]|uniref:Uncharacterized protein n=1 Tax=Chaetomium strumarium TaxID=1170767 RepID=A0AAJ0GNM4_9PEZI|nr:hypothetical protein B0T15DRAFT_269267 [Chaetomium strumarium]